MTGTPGSGYTWPPSPTPSTPGSESQRAQIEATLRTLREQRPQVAAAIGEYLYSLVLQGQMRDPIVLATCRRLYDHEQQIMQVEATLRALPAALPPVGQPLSAMPPLLSSVGSEESATLIAPPRRPEPVAPGAEKPAEQRCIHCRMPLRANDTTCPVCGHAIAEQAIESPQCRRCGTGLRPQDRSCPVCGTPR
ncbi:MAG: zinc ribbon domain-containing protein, partial [Chloroflexota bacterium]|nr:zinc ribbon domain-containing protein [Chloroflexota bacterium]